MRNRSENQITIVFIRHGETKSNREHRYLGKTEEALSEEGKSELKRQKEVGKYPELVCLFSSPMKRCRETAGILYPDLQPVVIAEWEEMDFGLFEGKNHTELQGNAGYQAWVDSNGTLPFPQGESREVFSKRCEKGFEKLMDTVARMEKEAGHPIERVGAIVHGGTIMALLSRYHGGEYFDYQVSNGEGYSCVLEKEEGRIISWDTI